MIIVRSVTNFFERLLRVTYSPYLIVFVPLLIASIRYSQEIMLLDLPYRHSGVFFHMFLFYSLLILLFALILNLTTGRPWRQTIGIAAVGLVLGILPPFLDLLLPGGEDRFYIYFPEFTWLFVHDKQLIGETVTVWFSILSSAVFVGWLTKSVTRFLAMFVLAYLATQFAAWGLPALLRPFSTQYGKIAWLDINNLAFMTVVFFLYVGLNWKTMGPTLTRFNHALPWGFLAAVGSRMSGESFLIAGAKGYLFAFSFLMMTYANDYFDREQDSSAKGKSRPVSSEDIVVILAFHVYLIYWAQQFHQVGWHLHLFFMSLALVYHIPQLRFKKLFCLGYKIEGLAAASAFMFGALLPNRYPDQEWLPLTVFLVLGGFSLGSMFKDYKDIDQDYASKVGTIYTRSLAKRRNMKNVHRFVALSLSIMLLVPAVWLLNRGMTGVGPWLLIVLAGLPTPLLLGMKKPKRAVESTLWALTAYLGLLMWIMPPMGG